MVHKDKENCEETNAEDEAAAAAAATTAGSEVPLDVPTSNKKICLKIKFPKCPQEAEVEEEEEKAVNEEEEEKEAAAVAAAAEAAEEICSVGEIRRYYCKECDKSFSSGKALGGHMSSAHVQAANKDQSFKKLNSSMMKRQHKASGSCLEEFRCMICNREFRSKKSLFGHMRCHPEREWRGMEPPQTEPPPTEPSPTEPPPTEPPPTFTDMTKIESPEDSSDTESDEDMPNLEEDHWGSDVAASTADDIGCNLKGWATKRGRRSNSPIIRPPPPPPPVPMSSEDMETFVAGHELIRLLKKDQLGKQQKLGGPEFDAGGVFKKQKTGSANMEKQQILERRATDDDDPRKIESNSEGEETLHYKGKVKALYVVRT